jgi:quinol monooxygenase YgiN
MNSNQAGYAVVDVWKVKPCKEDLIREVLAEARKRFSAHPDVLSVDYCLVDGDPSHYLVIFRYTSEEAREQFVASADLKSTMSTLSAYWDLEDIYVKGPSAHLP